MGTIPGQIPLPVQIQVPGSPGLDSRVPPSLLLPAPSFAGGGQNRAWLGTDRPSTISLSRLGGTGFLPVSGTRSSSFQSSQTLTHPRISSPRNVLKIKRATPGPTSPYRATYLPPSVPLSQWLNSNFASPLPSSLLPTPPPTLPKVLRCLGLVASTVRTKITIATNYHLSSARHQEVYRCVSQQPEGGKPALPT